MRSILHHQPSDGRRRRARPARPQTRLFHRRVSGKAASPPLAPPTTPPTAPPSALPGTASSATGGASPLRETASELDFAARRVRAAGGPTDEASYTCICGYVFSAPVSATVACPHCGCEQDW